VPHLAPNSGDATVPVRPSVSQSVRSPIPSRHSRADSQLEN